jgi:hypothetical protein
MSRNGRGAAPADHRNRPQDTEYAAAAKLATSHDHGTAATDSPARLLPPLLGYVTGGRDRPALNRLRTAAVHGRELVGRGADRTGVIFRLTLAAEIAGVARRDAEAVVRAVLGGAR